MCGKLGKIGSLVGYAGLLLAIVATVARAMGEKDFLQHESMTYFQAGVGLMVLGCFLKLEGMGCCDKSAKPSES